jgi:hypothetical protein
VSLLQVVEDLVVRRAKDAVGGGFEGSQNDGPKDVVDGERAHVLKISADIADFAKVGVNSVLGVTIPGHETSDLTGNEDSLHALVLEGERGQKSFPYHRTKLGRAVFVKNGVGVRKIGPQRHKKCSRRRYTLSSRRSRSCSYTDIHDAALASWPGPRP